MDIQIQIIDKKYVTPSGGLLVVTFTVSCNGASFEFCEGLVMTEHLGDGFEAFMDVPDATIIDILMREKNFANSQMFGVPKE